jgi:predicted ribosome quality control (RQC) complex YloA/Tae2 family protein
MKYKYLHSWVENTNFLKREIKSIKRFQDQYQIIFFKEEQKLQISLNQGNAFLFLTSKDELPFKQEANLNLFEHSLKRSFIKDIRIADNDRIVFIDLVKKDIYNEKSNYTLIIELAAKFENIILTEEQNKKLIIKEALKKFSFAENNQRQILPKMEWAAPQTDFQAIRDQVIFPLAVNKNNQIVEDVTDGISDMNLFCEELYYTHILNKKCNDLKRSALKSLKNELKKVSKKLSKQEAELTSAQSEEKWLHYAELLKSNIHLVKNGMDSVTVTNYYEDGFPELDIPLSIERNVQQNINFYFKKYKKSKSGKEIIKQQIAKTEEDILRKQQEIDVIEQETEYLELLNLNKNKKNKKQTLDDKVLFRRIKIDDNWEIFIGRSSKENDMLTCKVAKNRDWWFHTRIFQGTHVVLRNYANKQLPDRYRIICAQLAAYYSKAKKSENVPVDYTQIRYVRKPRGSVAGYVTYTNQKTIYVNPIDYREAARIIEEK